MLRFLHDYRTEPVIEPSRSLPSVMEHNWLAPDRLSPTPTSRRETPSPPNSSSGRSSKTRRQAYSQVEQSEPSHMNDSPFHSAGLDLPGSLQRTSFTSIVTPRPRYGRHRISHFWKLRITRTILLFLFVTCCIWRWGRSQRAYNTKDRITDTELKIVKERVQSKITKDLQFFSAINPKIHVRYPPSVP